MTLRIFPELEQGSDAWLAARCGILTASQIGKLITAGMKVADNETSRALTETLVAERLTGHVEYVHPTFDMQRGTLDEPYARALYAEKNNVKVEEIGFATNTFNGYTLGASPDGLVSVDGGLEIKSPQPKKHLRTILAGTIPSEYMAQIQASMLVLQRDWWDFCSYSGGWPIYVHRVHADPDWQALLIAALTQFETNAAQMIRNYETRTASQPIAPRIDHFAEIEIGL